MKGELFDTNVILEVYLERKYAKECEERIQESNIKYLTDFSVFSTILHIERIEGTKAVQGFLPFFLASGWTVLKTFPVDYMKIADISNQLKLDFDDALQVYHAKENQLMLITLDKDFYKAESFYNHIHIIRSEI